MRQGTERSTAAVCKMVLLDVLGCTILAIHAWGCVSVPKSTVVTTPKSAAVAVDIPSKRDDPDLAHSPLMSVPIKNATYHIVSSEGATDKDTTWNLTLPKLVSDGQYIYSLVAAGSFHDFNGALQIRRKRIGKEEAFATIWSKSSAKEVLGALFIDTHSALHVIYYQSEPGAPTRARLRYEKADDPRAQTVAFHEQLTPDDSLCATCRMGVFYKKDDDTIHVVNDSIVEQQLRYRRKKVTDDSWTTRETLQLAYRLLDGRFQYFYYPKIVFFKGQLHVFTTGNVFDTQHTEARFFNGIKHYYRDYNGPPGIWHNEWVRGPVADGTNTALYDAYVTRADQLALVNAFSRPQGKVKELSLFLSSIGFGDWRLKPIFSDENAQACVEQTADGSFHLFSWYPHTPLNYARSSDGVNWQFFQLPRPTGAIQRDFLSVNCMSTPNSASLQEPSAIVTGFTTGQSTAPANGAGPSFPHGHSVILIEVPK